MQAVEGQVDITSTLCVLVWKSSVSKMHKVLKKINF